MNNILSLYKTLCFVYTCNSNNKDRFNGLSFGKEISLKSTGNILYLYVVKSSFVSNICNIKS